MANSGIRPSLKVGHHPPVKTGECPKVADLIDYAQGQLGSDERQRIETHLKETSCNHCRSWITKASQIATDDTPLPVSLVSPPGQSQFPPGNSKWQQLAFRDLEERLRRLEDA